MENPDQEKLTQTDSDPNVVDEGHNMPEKNRLLLQSGGLGWYSDDLGITWTEATLPDCFLTYLGDGKVLAACETEILLSNDYGLPWQTVAPWPLAPNGQAVFGSFGPMLVDKDPSSGSVGGLADSCFSNDLNAYVRFSTDGGRTWPEVVKGGISHEPYHRLHLLRGASGLGGKLRASQ